MLRIAIIGAGLGGLCMGQGLRRHGIAFDIYEKDSSPSSRTQGYRIRIDETGQRSLAQCLPADRYDLFRASCAVTTTGGQFIGPDMSVIGGRAVETWRPSEVEDAPGEEAAGDLSANRLTLREVLLDGIADRVHFGKALSHVTETDDGVTVHFEDGSTAVADVVVAADGVNSTIRRQRLPHTEPADTGAVCLYGKTVLTGALGDTIPVDLLTGTSVVFADGFVAVLDSMTFRQSLFTPENGLTAVPDYLYWAVFGPRIRFGLDAADDPDQDALAVIERSTRDWHPALREVFATSDRNTVAAMTVRTAAAPEPRPAGRVTLLGDAIHAMSPAAGLGANTALRDAATLAAALGERPADPIAAVAAYEEQMRIYAGDAISASLLGSAVLASHG
ncbi:FAD-dependent oxidoreductase [Nocardia sp. NBC_01327]|uniref:FAD-dependent oxidoreductase n=1 Tax=Nocardia sp. NBC_01327 TaxID=2903593 RepID=UPI002E100CE8|nr:FAD-dependent monooxygenase [Nocardia sp. NBC_01327]